MTPTEVLGALKGLKANEGALEHALVDGEFEVREPHHETTVEEA